MKILKEICWVISEDPIWLKPWRNALLLVLEDRTRQLTKSKGGMVEMRNEDIKIAKRLLKINMRMADCCESCRFSDGKIHPQSYEPDGIWCTKDSSVYIAGPGTNICDLFERSG